MDVVYYSEELPCMIEMAGRLGMKQLMIIGGPAKELQKLQQSTPVTLVSMASCTAATLSRIRKDEWCIASPEKACAEHPRVAALIGGETLERKDKLHQKNSGMNMVVATTAARHGKVLLLDASALSLDAKSRILGRLFQNAMLAKKAKLPVLVVSGARHAFQMRSVQELKALASYLGVPPTLEHAAENALLSLLHERDASF